MTAATIYKKTLKTGKEVQGGNSNFPLLAIKNHLGKRKKLSKVRFRC